jgi:hypothetical protein
MLKVGFLCLHSSVNFPFLTDWLNGSSFASWQRAVATILSSILILNTGLFSGLVYAETFEVQLDEFREESPEDLEEFGLVNVLVENALMQDTTISNHVQRYCERVQDELGVVCLITPWEGETPSRIVEALQQMYFEGVEVSGGLGKLVGLVMVGDVPLPVVDNGIETFPSHFPYTDLVRPAYVYDESQGRFIRSSSDVPQAEIWHGLIRPPGDDEERREKLAAFFQKNAQFYEGADDYTLVKDKIGFHDHFWENDSFDNEAKGWYLKKLQQLDRLFNYRYSGDWLNQLSGEANDRLAQLTATTFEDSPISVDGPDAAALDSDIGFSPAAAEADAGTAAGTVLSSKEDIDAYGADRLESVVPDIYSPGPIRNFLKDYVNVVQRYISGSSELLDTSGRRQSHETLASLVTKMDKFYGSMVYLINQEFEQYLYQQAEQMALELEMVNEHEVLNDFYTEEATSFIDDLKSQLLGTDYAPLGVENEPKGNLRQFGSTIYTHFVNGIEVATVDSAEHCMLQRGSNFISDDGEVGKALTFNRKGNPLTSQDIAGAEDKQEIKRIYQEFGFCSYQVQDKCLPGAAKRPVFDFAAAEFESGDVDFRRCFGQDGPPAPKDTETSSFFKITSIINHVQPTGGVVASVLEKRLAHFLPIDAVRHASFFIGGASQYLDQNVARLRYPNFFDLEATGQAKVIAELDKTIKEKEQDLRKLRVDANWKRYSRYISLSTPAPGRDDFWNYNEIDGFEGRFKSYQADTLVILRREFDPNETKEDYELVERYLTTDDLSEEVTEELEELQESYFSNAFAQEPFDMTCSYTFDIPPVSVSLDIIKDDAEDLFSPVALLDAVQPPNFNPPAITRDCSNKVAKSTSESFDSFKDFYTTPEGGKIDIAILHKSDRFVEILDPVAVILYFTPAPPPLPPNTNMQIAIGLFAEQVTSLEGELEPLSFLSHEIKPVPLALPGELESLLDQHKEQLIEALNWLNLSIEAKHKEGLSLLTKDKEMVYLVLDGDADHVDFNFSGLKGVFEEDGSNSGSGAEDVLKEVRRRMDELKAQQEEKKNLRAEESQEDGQTQSECGDSVPLIEWPQAVVCWLDEIVAGPLIEAAPEEGEEEEGSSENEEGPRDRGQGPKGSGEISVTQSVMTVRDRVEASIALPVEVAVTWEGEGAIRVEPARDGKAIIIPERIGEGTVRARFDAGNGQQVKVLPVRVSGVKVFLRQRTVGDVRIGSDDVITMDVEVQDTDGELQDVDTALKIEVQEAGVFIQPGTVEVIDGKGSFEVRAGRKAQVSGLRVLSDTIAPSDYVSLHAIAGPVTELRWDFGDQIVGLDNEITGLLTVHDTVGNLSTAEGLRYELEWDNGLIINGRTEGRASFFAVAGESKLKIEFDESVVEEDDLDRIFGYFGYFGGSSSGSGSAEDAQALSVRVVAVDAFEAVEFPEALDLDLRRDYRVQILGVPQDIAVGQQMSFDVRVEGQDGVTPLNHKSFDVLSEFGGEVEIETVRIRGAGVKVVRNAPASAGLQKIVIDDPDFGTAIAEVQVIGRNAVSFALQDAEYVNGQLKFNVIGKDALGNKASLGGEVGQYSMIGDGAVDLGGESVALEDGIWEQVIEMQQQPDRLQLTVKVEGFDQTIVRELELEQRYLAAELAQLDWESPYMVLAGSAFGDYRSTDSVAQAMLYGGKSRLQALTTELTPHYGGQQLAKMWPSGRVEVGPDMKVEAIFDTLKPVLVFSSNDGEVGRLSVNPRRLPFVLEEDPAFVWTRAEGYGKAILVPDQGRYEANGNAGGDLFSPQGKKLMTFDQGQVTLHDPEIVTEVFADVGDVLILEFQDRTRPIARWYLHFKEEQVVQDRIAPLQWQATGQFSEDFDVQSFYAGEATNGPRGLVLINSRNEVRYSLGEGRSALDDVRENNGQGFAGDDKSVLSYLAGNTVGESTLLQSEGMITLGDPVSSLRLAKHELENGEAVSAVEATKIAAISDFSIGQLIFAPEDGEVTHLLRADVERDGEDDLLVVLDQGQNSVVHYLEGDGEGTRWGDVSQLLDLGDGVKHIEVVQGSSLLVLYQSGEVILQQNLQGRYQAEMLDLTSIDNALVTDISVRDFDDDRRDDLLFLTGDRELWVWYGTQSSQGLQFGLTDDDRQLLRLMSVKLQDFDNLKTGAWIHTKDTPVFEPNCREARIECQGKYFRGFAGISDEGSFLDDTEEEEEVDRLAELVAQSEDTDFKDQDEAIPEQEFLVRLDQAGFYKDTVDIRILNANEGSQLNQGQQLDFEVIVAPRRSEDVFVLNYSLGSDFKMIGRVECDGCDDDLKLRKTPDTLWKLEGKVVSARQVTLRFSLEYVSLPDFSFQVMQTNEDQYPDIGINVADNSTGRITVFESRGPREYVETLFGDGPGAGDSTAVTETLSDLMRGIGLEGKTQDQLKEKILNQQSEMEALTGDLLDNVHQDNNVDGYPDLYQENPSLFPDAAIQSSETKQEVEAVSFQGPKAKVQGPREENRKGNIISNNLNSVSNNQQSAINQDEDEGVRSRFKGDISLFDRVRDALIPKTFAQAKNVDTFNTFKSDSFSNLDNTALMFDNIEADVQMVVKALKCSRGCLPLPINFAFLAPGPINIMGVPAGFDPGLPIFGISAVPFFVWPPLVPYQATQFRIYLSPTLTLGLGIGICLGPYLLGQCFVFSIPIGNLLGSESVCDSIKEGLGGMMKGIQSTVGNVTQGIANAVNSTGVIKAEVPANPTEDIESILGVSIGGSTQNKGVDPEEQKVFLNPVPDIFVDWWDRQWEEVVNSLTDLPDITVRLPDFGSSFDPDYFDKLSEKVSGDSLLNLQELYDVINSLPAVTLNPDVIQIQIPWIEPGILRKIEQSLYKFLHGFLLEFAAFLHSFNLPCNINLTRQNLFKKVRDLSKQKEVSEAGEARIREVQALMEGEKPNIQQAKQNLAAYTEAEGFAQATVTLRRDYFNEMEVRHERVKTLNARYDQMEAEINRIEEPQKITDILPVFGEIMKATMEFWQEQREGFTAASVGDGVKRESVDALRSCVAIDVALDIGVDVTQFVDSIQKNIEAIEEWKKFPRKLARYLNALEFYMQEVVELIDQITSIVLDWWVEFERKLDLWIDVIFAYQELIALINLIIDILKGYNKKCGLCTSDRLTLKDIILKLVFGVVPKFPILDFPSWPDIRLDFSDVQFAIDVTLPVFEVKTVDLRWPELPELKFPRFDDFDLDVALGAKASIGVKLPQVPLLIPSPPDLPPLQPLPDLPQINLPNLPPAPEVPEVLESLLPLMRIIQVILDIWCLINKSLIPIDEKQLKTQIENLTNRSGNLILPIDVLLTFDLFPGDLLSDLIPFDTIDVTTKFQAGVNIEPLPDIQETIDEQFHEPINTFTGQVDVWIQQLRNAMQDGANTASGELQDTLGNFQVDGISIEGEANVNAGLNLDGTSIEAEFPGLLNYQAPERPTWHQDVIERRKENLTAQNNDIKRHLDDVRIAVNKLNAQEPEQVMEQLASLAGDNVLVAGEPSLLKYRVSEEKRQAILDPSNFVERKVNWFDRKGLIAQVTESGSALKDVQDKLLDTSASPGVENLGVAVVRDGQAGRLQDYPLDDPVLNVWDNDVFLAYENAVYLKASDNSARRHDPYQGRVLQSSLDRFQRSKVHQLDVSATSGPDAGSGSATLTWTWEELDTEDVELTIWDSVGAAQRIDQDHLRFYLHQESDSPQRFEVITPGTDLVAGQSFLTARDVRLRYGLDQVLIPRGVVFTVPSFELRSLVLDGSGTVEIENVEGETWDIELGDDVSVEFTGLTILSIPEGQKMKVPRFKAQPYIRSISGTADGALKLRTEVVSGEKVPAGLFASHSDSRLSEEDSGASLTVPRGMTFDVPANADWKLDTGRGMVVTSDELEYREVDLGFVIMDDELIRGSFIVQDGIERVDILPEQQVVWSEVKGPRFEVTVPVGNYYGRIREREGLRGYSPILHAAAQPVFASAQVLPGIERIPVPIYTPVTVEAREYVIGDLPDESHHWRLNEEQELVSGSTYRHAGFDQVGLQDLQLFVRDGEDDFVAKSFQLDVFIPELTIDETLYEENRIIRVESDPPVANIPIGIVGERDGVKDWLLTPPVEGAKLDNRYFTNAQGVVQLAALPALEGLNVIVDGGMNIARLYPSGRVVLHEQYKEECQNEPLHDTDGFLKFRVSCIIDGRLIEKFESRMVPHRDTDVTIVDDFGGFDVGVVIRSLQSSLELVPLAASLDFAGGGAQLRIVDGDVLFVISPGGEVELNQANLTILQKPFADPAEPLIWQVLQNGAILAEIQILGPGDKIDVIDPLDRDILPGDDDGDGLLDRWETTYGVQDPTADPDTDGLTNLEEFQLGTHPRNIDTDGDGLSDGEEQDPLDGASSVRSINFDDVPESSPYFEAIMELAGFGFIQGYGDGSFRPDQPVTRAEAIKILMSVIRCENCEFPSQLTKDEFDPTLKGFEYFVQFHDGVFGNSSSDPLKNFAFVESDVTTRDPNIRTYLDVAVNDWFYYCVEIATELGLINGYRGFEEGVNALGSFLPERNVNVAELMKMVIEAVGDKGKQSDRVYEPAVGWWNDPNNNYLARAEEDLQLLLEAVDYSDPLRKTTRAEVAYAAFRVLRENGVLDFDGDGVANQSDDCPCQPGIFDTAGVANGCPFLDVRRPERLFEGIEIVQSTDCRCLALVDADLFLGSRFFAVITGRDEVEVIGKSNTVP